MRNLMFFLFLMSILSCKRDKPLPPLKPAYQYPELKGYWYVENAYPFWNLKHTQTTSCVGMAKFYFIDSISPTQYVIYEGDFFGRSYDPSVRVDMQLDTLTDSLYFVYGHDTQYYNPFANFFKLDLKYDHTSKNIVGEIGVISMVGCTDLPTDHFEGKTKWSKYP